jgi:hypothetical protein
VGVFGPGMEKALGRVSPQGSAAEVGETSAAINSQPARNTSVQPPLQSAGGSTNSAASAKRGESASPTASAKHGKSSNPVAESLSGSA